MSSGKGVESDKKGVTSEISIDEQELKDLGKALCELGESLGYKPDRFAIMVSMCATILCEVQGIEVHSYKKDSLQ